MGWCWRNAESLVQRACDRTAGTQPASSSASTSGICVSSIVLDKPSLRCYQIISKRVVGMGTIDRSVFTNAHHLHSQGTNNSEADG